MPSLTSLAAIPSIPANGMARPATRTPSTLAHAAITPRCFSTVPAGGPDSLGLDMASNVRESAEGPAFLAPDD